MLRGKIHLHVNTAYARLYGYPDPESLHRTEWARLYPDSEAEKLRREGIPAVADGGSWRSELQGIRQNGSRFAQDLTLTRLDGDRVLCIVRDVSRRKEMQERLERLAYHDPLTGLANRRLLEEKARQLLALAARSGQDVGLLYVDVDDFKSINDNFGHPTGDLVLKQVGRRLESSIREADTAARLGGDEFGVLLGDIEGEEGAMRAAGRVLDSFDAPFEGADRTLSVGASIGVTLFPKYASSFQELIAQADRAMYGASRDKEVGARVFRPGLGLQAPRYRGLTEELRAALKGYRLVLYYQPVRDLSSGKVVGAEALVRWPHRRLGLLPAAKFVPLAEDSGLAVRLDRWALASAILQAQAWRDSSFPGWIAVHLSDPSLHDPELAPYLERTLEAVDESIADRLILEIPARSANRESKGLEERANELRELGVRLAVDGFGSGQPSPASLKRLPAQLINLDSGFLRAIGGHAADEEFLQSVIDFAHSLEIDVRAKGVEREREQEWLREAGCDYAQGYLVGWTAPPDELLSADGLDGEQRTPGARGAEAGGRPVRSREGVPERDVSDAGRSGAHERGRRRLR